MRLLISLYTKKELWMHLKQRPRRLRMSQGIRNLVREHQVTVDDLIMPLFVKPGNDGPEEISSMPGQYRYNLEDLLKKCEELVALGLNAIALFPVLNESSKTLDAREAINSHGLYPSSITAIKKKFPDLLVMTDMALDPYSCTGHDGLVDEKTGEILNDETVDFFKEMALVHAKAGADIIGPSDMMDGRVRVIRDSLESQGFHHVLILSYCVKYASHFYGPFRDALDSAPKLGDKKSYQMDYANDFELRREVELDIAEGADMLMVKPALSYLDCISQMKKISHVPVVAYNVSGEYAMVKAAAQNGWIDEASVRDEILTSMKRAGADIILTYFAEEMARGLNKA